ncbi:MAG TPA: tetratricopeptide repeat protein [Tenuifilaceae bacterium]|nr:tetratricopeptide repeat protein [Tenuifilaceae bacterium]
MRHFFPLIIKTLVLLFAIISPLSATPSTNAKWTVQWYQSFNDSLLNSSLEFMTEDPQRALLLANNVLKNTRLENDAEKQKAVTILIANIYVNAKDKPRAEFYLNSLEKEVNTTEKRRFVREFTFVKANYLAFVFGYSEAVKFLDEKIQKARSLSDLETQTQLLHHKAKIQRDFSLYKESVLTLNIAIEVAQKTNNKLILAECFSILGSSYYMQSNYDEAIQQFGIATDNYQSMNDSIGVLESYIDASIAKRDLGRFPESEKDLDYALKIAVALKDNPSIAEILNLKGSLELRKNDPASAVSYYTKSVEIRIETGYRCSSASTYENLSRVYAQLNQFEKAKEVLHKSIDIRNELNDEIKLASAYNDMGNIYLQNGELADAIRYYLLSLKIRQQLGAHSDASRTLTNIGIVYRMLGSNNNALNYFNRALELISEETDPLGKAYVFINQGNTYRDLGSPEQALESYKKALNIRIKTGNMLSSAQALRSVANAYADMNSFSEAKKALGRSLDIFRENDDQRGIADTENELGNVLLKEGRLEDAMLSFEKASILYGKIFDLDRRGLCLRKIGEIQVTLGQYTIAHENLQLALSLANSTNNGKLLETSLLAFHNYFLHRGNYNQALDFYKKHITVRDSLEGISQKESIWQASLDLELNKKAEEIKMIESEVNRLVQEDKIKTYEIERQKMRSYFLTLGLVFILLLASASLYGYLVIRKKNILLNEVNEKLTESEKELKATVKTKDKLFSIIAHDLKSPFTALVGLTEVMKSKTGKENAIEITEYAGYVHDSSQNLLNLIENLLGWARSQTASIKLNSQKINIIDIFETVKQQLSLQANSKNIQVIIPDSKGIEVFCDRDTIVTVLRNLVSNAIKFSNVDSKVLLLVEQKGAEVLVSVKDNGVGMSEKNLSELFSIDGANLTEGTHKEKGTGLGLIVCKEFVEANGGKIWAESKMGFGSTFNISLPLI